MGQTNGTLNVLLHGTFAYNEEPEGITAYIPVIDHHVYRAGHWLGETDLVKGEYKLEGVRDEVKADQFDMSKNLILKPLPDKKNPAHATLNLGKPRKITSLRVAPIKKTDFDPPAARAELLSTSDTLHIATLQIFSYDIADESGLRLQAAKGRGHYWEPVFSGDFVNLHIFSEEDHYDQPSFGDKDLLSALNVLGSEINHVNVKPARRLEPDETLPEGVRPEETEDLAPRTKRMARLGRLVAQYGDPNQAWYPNDALDEDPPACGSPVERS
jgi:hypothetical protein